jgi:fermentation-respiration switch protein FrsA (DUF1100 family)
VPILFVVGTNDEIVPAIHVKQLHDAATGAESRDFFEVVGGMHNDTWFKGGKDYNDTVAKFLEKAKLARKNRSKALDAFGKEPETEDIEEDGKIDKL